MPAFSADVAIIAHAWDVRACGASACGVEAGGVTAPGLLTVVRRDGDAHCDEGRVLSFAITTPHGGAADCRRRHPPAGGECSYLRADTARIASTMARAEGMAAVRKTRTPSRLTM